MIETLSSLDEQILLFFNGYHSTFMDEAMALITSKWIWIPFYAILIDLLFRRRGPKYAIMTLIAVAVAITLTDQVCAHVMRPYVARLRPCNVDSPIYPLLTFVKDVRAGGYSWPSCHAANTFALATLLSCVMRSRKFTIVIFAWAAIVSISRLYCAVHYPSDVISGAIFGCIFGFVSLVVVRWLYFTAIPNAYHSIFNKTDREETK